MDKAKFYRLLRDVRAFMAGRHPLIIVGSQSAHGQVDWLPHVATSSLEADFFMEPGGKMHDPIEEEFGLDSAWHAAHGVYADPLGAGIVSLPPGWRERLVTLSSDDGDFTYQALEIYDTAVSKLMAGRPKDWSFLAELLFAGALECGRFLERSLLMRDTVHSGALRPRLESLAAVLRDRRMHEALKSVEHTIRQL